MIKQCPPPCTCNNSAVVHIDNGATNTYCVTCPDCKRVGPAKVTIREAIIAWNDSIVSTPIVLTGNE